MRFSIKQELNDGMAEAPALVTGEIRHLDQLMSQIRAELTDDNGQHMPVGATVTITRIA